MIYQPIIDRCKYIPTEGMDFDQWLDERRKGIGGSDAAALMEMTRFGSPWSLYREKKNMVPKSEMSKAARRGKILEPYIRKETMTDFPEFEISEVPFMFFHPDYHFMVANLDGVIFCKSPTEIRGVTIQGLGGHEIKSGKTDYGWTYDEIPDHYYCQVQHYMAVTGLKWFLVSAYILDDDEGVYHYIIPRSEQFIEKLIAAEKNFWENNILKNIMPAPLGLDFEEDMITGEYEEIQETINLGNEWAAMCAERIELKKAMKDMEQRQKVIDITIKERISEICNEKIGDKKTDEKPEKRKVMAKAGGYEISWSRYPRSGVDSDALKRDGLYDKYSKVSESGRFDVKVV